MSGFPVKCRVIRADYMLNLREVRNEKRHSLQNAIDVHVYV